MTEVVSLFCGCGGLDFGFHENPECKVILAVDAMPEAVETYRANYPGSNVVCGDVLDTTLDGSPDVVIGGPPCQDFSSAGKRVQGGRAGLTTTYCDFVLRHRPKIFVMENVPAIRGKAILADILKRFKDGGYGLTSRVVRMSDYGVPQSRRRYILIGRLGGPDGEFDGPLEQAMSPVRSLSEYAGTIPDLTRKFVYRHARSYSRRAVFSVDDEVYPTVRNCLRRMPPNYSFHRGDRIKDRSQVCDPTVPMMAAVQSFPGNWVWPCSRSATMTLIANAVPPEFSRVLSRLIIKPAT